MSKSSKSSGSSSSSSSKKSHHKLSSKDEIKILKENVEAARAINIALQQENDKLSTQVTTLQQQLQQQQQQQSSSSTPAAPATPAASAESSSSSSNAEVAKLQEREKQLQGEIERLEAEVDKLEDQVQEQIAERQTLEEQLDTMLVVRRQEERGHELKHAALQEKLAAATAELQHLTSQLPAGVEVRSIDLNAVKQAEEQKAAEWRALQAELETALQQERDANTALAEQLETERAALSAATERAAELQKFLTDLEQLRHADSQATQAELAEKTASASERIALLEADVAKHMAAADTYLSQRDEAHALAEGLTADASALNEQLTELHQKADASQARIHELESALTDANAQLESAKQENDKLSHEKQELHEQVRDLLARVDLVSDELEQTRIKVPTTRL